MEKIEVEHPLRPKTMRQFVLIIFTFVVLVLFNYAAWSGLVDDYIWSNRSEKSSRNLASAFFAFKLLLGYVTLSVLHSWWLHLMNVPILRVNSLGFDILTTGRGFQRKVHIPWDSVDRIEADSYTLGEKQKCDLVLFVRDGALGNLRRKYFLVGEDSPKFNAVIDHLNSSSFARNKFVPKS